MKKQFIISMVLLISMSVVCYAQFAINPYNGNVVYPNPRAYGGVPCGSGSHRYGIESPSKCKGKKLETKAVTNNNFQLFKIDKIGEQGFFSYKNTNLYSYILTDTTNLVVGSLFKLMEKDFEKKRVVVNYDIVYVWSKK